MGEKQEACECDGVARGPTRGAREQAGLGDDRDEFATSLDRRDTAKELAGVNGGIFFGESVATRGENDAIALGPLAGDAMNVWAATEKEENDFTAACCGDIMRADGEQIAGID
jgi:hypothetical protein